MTYKFTTFYSWVPWASTLEMLQFNILLVIQSLFLLVAWKLRVVHVTETDLEGWRKEWKERKDECKKQEKRKSKRESGWMNGQYLLYKHLWQNNVYFTKPTESIIQYFLERKVHPTACYVNKNAAYYSKLHIHHHDSFDHFTFIVNSYRVQTQLLYTYTKASLRYNYLC